MKRLLLMTAGLLVLLLLGGALFVAYRQHQSYQITVPQRAVSAVKIHVDGLVADIAWNKCWNWQYDRQPDRKNGWTDGLPGSDAGIDVPANLFLYRFADVPAFFGVLPIADIAEFRAFISQHSEWTYEQVGDTAGRLLSDHLLALHDTDRVAFALFWEAGNNVRTETYLQELLGGNKQVPLATSPFAALRGRKGHLNMMGRQSLRVDFKSGVIRFAIAADPGNVTIPTELKAGATGLLRLPAAYATFISTSTWRLGDHILHRDSIAGYIHGSLRMRWEGVTRQLDTVVNYEFDEDFNPIAIRDTIAHTIPAVYSTVSSDEGRLTDYLITQGVLDTAQAQINPAVFPLFPLYVQAIGDNLLQVTTVQDAKQKPTFDLPDDNDDALLLYLDVAAIAGQAILPERFNRYLAPFATIEAEGVDSGGNEQWPVRGVITMRHASVNSLVQLFRR